MRLDKYLKVSRIIKRRPLAKKICEAGGIIVNGRVAKASTEIKVNDIIEVKLGTKNLKVQVTNVLPFSRSEEAASLYKVLKEN